MAGTVSAGCIPSRLDYVQCSPCWSELMSAWTPGQQNWSTEAEGGLQVGTYWGWKDQAHYSSTVRDTQLKDGSQSSTE